MQKPTGIKRVRLATGYSIAGLKATFRHEAAFRQEVVAAAILLPLAFLLDVSVVERVIMICTIGLVLIVELLNSAIESVVDRIGPEHHELAGRAKDIGSAAVFVAILLTIYVWVDIGMSALLK